MNVITRILTTPEAVKELTAAPVKKGIDWERIIGIYLTVSLSRQLFVPILRASPLRRARTTVEAPSQQASQL